MRNEKGNAELGILATVAAGVAAIAWKAGLLLGLSVASSGCMQLTGAKKIDAWGLVMEANNGIELTAGVQQYDRVNNVKGIGSKKDGE